VIVQITLLPYIQVHTIDKNGRGIAVRVQFDRFPGGRTKALTLSYDDGRTHDRRLVNILNQYGVRGTFHLNSGSLGKPDYITREEVKSLFAGHEVSAHSVTHPFLELTPKERLVMEMMDDRRTLEQIVGYPVRGMSYPFGTYSQSIVDTLPALGIRYARTVNSHGTFAIPENPLLWNPTCHHKTMQQHVEAFLKPSEKQWSVRMELFYVWGHSYEFENDNNWEELESFCRSISGHDMIWYATNMEIIDYLDALNQLQFSVDESLVRNPSAIPVWLGVDGQAVKIEGGEIRALEAN
jgi:hypothetical protein